MRRFMIEQLPDKTKTNVSSFVAEGLQFTDGTCAVCWRVAPSPHRHITQWRSYAFYYSLDVTKQEAESRWCIVRLIDETDPPHELDCPAILCAVHCDCGLGLKPTNP